MTTATSLRPPRAKCCRAASSKSRPRTSSSTSATSPKVWFRSNSSTMPAGEITVHPGDVVDVMIDHGERLEGYVLLSHVKAARLRVWDNLEKAFNEQLIISGHVLGRVKGGLSVDVGIKAFMPGSQADPRPAAQSGFPDRPGHSGQDHQAQPPPRQRGGFAQAGGRAGDQRAQVQSRSSTWKRVPW